MSSYNSTCIVIFNFFIFCLVISATRPRVSQKASNRWFVTYTLIKNPQLTKSYKRDDLTSVCTKKSLSDNYQKFSYTTDYYQLMT